MFDPPNTGAPVFVSGKAKRHQEIFRRQFPLRIVK